jgi:hypothetical protein
MYGDYVLIVRARNGFTAAWILPVAESGHGLAGPGTIIQR